MSFPDSAMSNAGGPLNEGSHQFTSPATSFGRPPPKPHLNKNIIIPVDKPPITTVFVGNISEKVSDVVIRQLLLRCGNMLSWKRVQGASGKLQAFGFCEYEEPEATLRCIRILNGWKVADKNLLVKVDPKTKDLLDDYKRKKRKGSSASKEDDQEANSTSGDQRKKHEADTDNDFDSVDESALKYDEAVRLSLEAVMREFMNDIARMEHEEKKHDKHEDRRRRDLRLVGPKHLTIDDMQLDNDQVEIINREIESFRKRHKDEDDFEERDRRLRQTLEAANERHKRKSRRSRSRSSTRRHHASPSVTKGTGNSSAAITSKSPDKRTSATSRSPGKRENDREHKKSKKKKEKKHHSRSRSRSRDTATSKQSRRMIGVSQPSNRHEEDKEDEIIRKKMESKLREKEVAYQEQLKRWEARERKRLREYERETEHERQREAENAAEAKRLKEFLEDYDDCLDDPKYYKGSSLDRRKKDRETEETADERDRHCEMEQLEVTKRSLLESGDPDTEQKIIRMEQEVQEHLRRRMVLLEENVEEKPRERDRRRVTKSSRAKSRSPERKSQSSKTKKKRTPPPSQESSRPAAPAASVSEPVPAVSVSDSRVNDAPVKVEESVKSEEAEEKPAVKLDHNSPAEEPATVEEPGQQDQSSSEETDQVSLLPVKSETTPDTEPAAPTEAAVTSQPLQQWEPEEGSGPSASVVAQEQVCTPPAKREMTAAEKKAIMKRIIESIPTTREHLFVYTIDWTLVDADFVYTRIKPWVDKKILAYIGEEEPTLVKFICDQVVAHNSPSQILHDIAMVLDDEAEVFVVKMWRLLIYVIEEKKAGLQ